MVFVGKLQVIFLFVVIFPHCRIISNVSEIHIRISRISMQKYVAGFFPYARISSDFIGIKQIFQNRLILRLHLTFKTTKLKLFQGIENGLFPC